MFAYFITCISTLHTTFSSNRTFKSNIPTLSSCKSFSNIGVSFSFTVCTLLDSILLISPFVILSFPTCPNILLNT